MLELAVRQGLGLRGLGEGVRLVGESTLIRKSPTPGRDGAPADGVFGCTLEMWGMGVKSMRSLGIIKLESSVRPRPVTGIAARIERFVRHPPKY